MAATPLPYTEDLGNILTSGCDAQWKDGDCESGWSGYGDNNTLEVVTADGYTPTEHGIRITPGTDFWNGLHRDFEVTPGERFEWTFPVQTVGGTAKYGVRATFKNASGVTLSVETQVTVVDEFSVVTNYFLVPANASTVTLFMGVKDGSVSGTRAVLANFCVLGVMGCFGGGTIEPHPELTCFPPPPCPECDFSCPDGGTPIAICDIDFDTCRIRSQDCQCPDDEVCEILDWL